jgi:protein-L-isoaspartate O-methyltransferase
VDLQGQLEPPVRAQNDNLCSTYWTASEVAQRIPAPHSARKMLDIGGSIGYYSVILCRRLSGLQSVVFDLPEAVVHASKILAQERMGKRIAHRAGNVLTDDLGNEEYDLIFIGISCTTSMRRQVAIS